MDIYKKFDNIKIGATLTFDNKTDSLENEPGASTPEERINALKILHENGIKTWSSFEPVIIPLQSINLIKKTIEFIDEYKLGKWNHDNKANEIDWANYAKKAISILRSENKQFYVKEDLRKYITGLTEQESDMDYLNLKYDNIQKELAFG